MSKHSELSNFISLITKAGVNLEIIALQETWALPNPDLINIPGFTFIFKNRKPQRGGGVGFYIKTGISYKIINVSNFEEKLFENLTIEIKYKTKKVIISNIYRSPAPIASITTTQFINTLEIHLNSITQLCHSSFIFLDSNINLFKLNDADGVNRYFTYNTLIWLQTINKKSNPDARNNLLSY